MRQAVRNYLVFLWRSGRLAFVGDWRYYTWMGALTVLCLLGLNAYAKQFANGLITTGMSDEVSWGVYIANFTFLVGVAAAAVMMVIPVYIYNNEELHDLVIFGELLAVAAILMCLAFVTVDLGRPDRFWHLIPGIGQFNFPASMLSWDVLVLNGYLLLNVHICGYLLYCRYRGRAPAKWFYIPFVFIAIVWAVSIHTVTAFLEFGDRWAAVPCIGVHCRAGVDHPGDASGPPRDGHRSWRRCLEFAGRGRAIANAEEPHCRPRRPRRPRASSGRICNGTAGCTQEHPCRRDGFGSEGWGCLSASRGDGQDDLFCLEGPSGCPPRGGRKFPGYAQPGAGRTVRRNLSPCRNAAHGHGHRRRARPGPEPAGGRSAEANGQP